MKAKPESAENVPPPCPVTDSVVVPDLQNEPPVIVAVGNAFTVTVDVVEFEQVPFVNVYVAVYVPAVLAARFI